jgi:ribosomal-protein-alanine N-acetyltransferase
VTPGSVPRLETQRLVLDAPEAADTPHLVELANDIEVARLLGRMPHPYGKEDARHFLETVARQEMVWAVRLKPVGQLAGIIGLAPGRDGAPPELGYWYGREHWGRGIATDAGRAVVAHALGAMGLLALHSGHFEANAASGRVLKKLGFVETGRSTRPSLLLGRDLPHIDMRLGAQRC